MILYGDVGAHMENWPEINEEVAEGRLQASGLLELMKIARVELNLLMDIALEVSKICDNRQAIKRLRIFKRWRTL